jgi:hypothetical protein
MAKLMTMKTTGNNIVAINVNEISSIEQKESDVIRIIMSNGRFYDVKGTVDSIVKVIKDNLE